METLTRNNIEWTVGHWTHEPTGSEETTYVGMSTLGDRYLIHPPASEFDGGEWHVYAERDYATLVETATTRLPSVILPATFSLDTAKEVAQADATAQARFALIASGEVSDSAPWTLTRVEYRLQTHKRHDDDTRTWEDMYTLSSTDDPARTMRAYGTNPYRRVVKVEITETITPL
jgi:hypothetical protein